MALLNSLVHSIIFLFFINTTSLLTSLGICRLFNESFIDCSKQYSPDYIREKTNAVMNYHFYSIFNHHLFFWGFSHSISNIVNVDEFTFFYNVWRYLEFMALLEFFFCLFHRLSHTPYIYKHFHSHHHKNVTIYPIDAIDADYFDSLGFTLSLHLPLLLVPLTYYEYAFLYYFYSTGIVLVHSRLITDIHVLHHVHFKHNYCLLFPLYE